MQKVVAILTGALVSVCVAGEGSGGAQTDSLRAAKRTAVSFRPAARVPTRGYEKMTLGRDEQVYVAPKAALSGAEVVSAEAIESRGEKGVELTLADKAAERLAAMMRKHKADRLAIFLDGELIATGEVKFDTAQGRATIAGLSPIQADRLTRVLNAKILRRPIPAGPVITAVPAQSVAQPGEAVTIDVFVSGVSDLRAYQVTLVVSGGKSGWLVREDMSIDDERADYVFGTLEKLNAVDTRGGRIGGVLISDAVDAPASGYLGSYTLRASDDASGAFQVNVRTTDEWSMLIDSNSETIGFSAGPAARIFVGATPRRLGPTRK